MMTITSQVGSVKYATTPGFNALLLEEPEFAEQFMSDASSLINNKTDMVIGDNNITRRQYEDEGRTVRILTHLQTKVYAMVNETGGITYMLAEEY